MPCLKLPRWTILSSISQSADTDFTPEGKNFGVQVTHENGKNRNYRFSTLGIHEEFQDFQDRLSSMKEEEATSRVGQEPGEMDTSTARDIEGRQPTERNQPRTQNEKTQGQDVPENVKRSAEKEALKQELKRHRKTGGKTENEDDQSL